MMNPLRKLKMAAGALAVTSFVALPSALSAKDVTIVYSDWQAAQTIWGPSLRTALDRFEAANPGIKIKVEPIAMGQRDTKYSTSIRGGKGPDVFALDANPIKRFIKEGWVKDLTPFIDKEGGKKWLSDFYPNALQPMVEGERVYGVPKNVVAMVIMYNTDLFKKAGVSGPPKTWDEFRATAKKLTRSSAGSGPIDRWGTVVPLAHACFNLRFSAVVRGFGGDFLAPDWKSSVLDKPKSKQSFQYVVDMINKDKTMPPGVAQVDCNDGRRLMANEKVAMMIGTMWTIKQVNALNPKLNAAKVLEMAPIPQNPGETSKLRSTLYEKALFMNPNTENPEAAWKVIKFLTDGPQMQQWYDKNDMLSARKSVNETYKPIVSSKFADIVKKEIAYSDFLPLIPQWPEIQETYRQAVQDAVAKNKTVDAALTDAHNQINAILAR